MVKFFPERDYIKRMNPNAAEAELFLLKFLQDYLGGLSGEFEVFFRARLNEGLTNFVVVRKNHGILIITVADGNSDSFAVAVKRAKLSKKLFFEACRIRSYNFPVQAAAFFYGATAEQVKKFFGFPKDTDAPLLYNYVLLLTADTLARDGLQSLPKMNFLIGDNVSGFFTDEIYDDICRAIKPFGEINSAEDLSAAQRKCLETLLGNASPNVKFFPALAEIPYLRPLPTEGEFFLLKFLRDYLGKKNGEYEIFFQAHWDGLKPDIVVVRKNHGVLIIEVKDWNLDAYRFRDVDTWTVVGNEQTLKSPTAQAQYYKNLFYDTYSRTLAEKNFRDKKFYSLVQTAVFFYGATEAQVSRIPKDNYVIFFTREELEKNGLNKLRYADYFFGDRMTDFFSDDVYNELCRVLKPSEHSLSKIFFPAQLSKEQQEKSRSKRAYKHHLKGPAGSGKTTVLAFRAVDAFRKTNKPVLILTYNITLCNYIHDCISQALNSVSGLEGRKGYILRKFFVIQHYHGFIHDYRNKFNLSAEYKPDKNGNYVDTYELSATPIKYRTIYVDETQDFSRGWMDTIVKLLEPNGELVFFSDKDQDLYHVRELPSVPVGRGNTSRLKGSYRLHTKILDLAQNFRLKFFAGSEDNEAEPPPEKSLFDEYADDATTVRYHYFDSLDVNAIVEIFRSVIKEYNVANDDVCILSQVIRNVRPVDKVLRDSGYKTTTTFEREEDYQKSSAAQEEKIFYGVRRTAKFCFWMESGKVKLATIQSYKGWGVHTEILIIGNDNSVAASDEEKFLNAEMVYTGITRAKKNLVVINVGDREYDEFFRAAVNSPS